MIGVRDASMARIARIQVRDGGGLDNIAAGRIRGASGLSAFFSAMAAEASTPGTAYANSSSPADIVTNSATCAVTGGVAPYTYLWSEVSSSITWTIADATAASASFTAEAVDPGIRQQAVFKCTVTDASSVSVDSNEITVNAVNLGGGL